VILFDIHRHFKDALERAAMSYDPSTSHTILDRLVLVERQNRVLIATMSQLLTYLHENSVTTDALKKKGL